MKKILLIIITLISFSPLGFIQANDVQQINRQCSFGCDHAFIKNSTINGKISALLSDWFPSHEINRSYAVIIGINKFDEYNALPTEKDPIRVKNYLINEAGFDLVHVLTGRNVTEQRLGELMHSISKRIGSNDRFLFYWQGHGETLSGEKGPIGYLPMAHSKNKQPFTMLPMRRIEEWNDWIPARHALYMLDACFSGLAGVSVQSNELTDMTLKQLSNKGRHMITAGKANEQTFAHPNLGGSVFTTAVLQGLRGKADVKNGFEKDGVISLSELALYLRKRINLERARYNWYKPITPQITKLSSDDGMFFFFTQDYEDLSSKGITISRDNSGLSTQGMSGTSKLEIHSKRKKTLDTNMNITKRKPTRPSDFNSSSPVGVNTNEILDDDASAPFIDVFRNSTPFEEARPWLTKGKIDYDINGWPINLNGGQVGARFINKLPAGTIPDGYYTVLYDGVGTLSYGNDATFISKSAGREIISIFSGADKEIRATLQITQTDTKNPLRNIRILMPGGICSNNPYKRVHSAASCRGQRFLSFEKYASQIIFNPDYLNYMKDFKVLRFMNMAGITRNPIKEWSKRPLMTKSTWGGSSTVRGAPLEIMVALANRNNSDAWFSIPHAANDQYIRKFAQYVRDNLKPSLKVYIEYTNEAWNTIFDQAHYIKDMGLKLGLDQDRDKAGYKYYSSRSVQVFNIFEQEFGGLQRLVRVMAGWTGYTRLTEMLLSYRNAYKMTDAFAIGPYFYGSFSAMKKVQSVDQVFDMLYDKTLPFSIPGIEKLIGKHAELTQSYGVSLIAYEGGQHLVDWKNRDITKAPTKYYIAANRDWRMATAYRDFLNGWKRAGGQIFVSFSAPRTYQWFGSWGTREYLTQPISKAPKHKAILDFIKSNQCWWRNCNNHQIARLAKPVRNPNPIIFSQVPSKKRKNNNE